MEPLATVTREPDPCSANRLLLQQSSTPRGEISTKTLGNWLMSVHAGCLCPYDAEANND